MNESAPKPKRKYDLQSISDQVSSLLQNDDVKAMWHDITSKVKQESEGSVKPLIREALGPVASDALRLLQELDESLPSS